MARRNKFETTSKPHEQVITKAIRTFQGSRHNIPSCISNRTSTSLEDTRRISRIPPHSLSGDGTTRTQLYRTATRYHRRRTRMGSQADTQSTTLWTQQEAPILCQMEGLLPFA